MIPGLDLYGTDPAKSFVTAGNDTDDLDRDIFEVCDCFNLRYS